jgi:hypothetical protein
MALKRKTKISLYALILNRFACHLMMHGALADPQKGSKRTVVISSTKTGHRTFRSMIVRNFHELAVES